MDKKYIEKAKEKLEFLSYKSEDTVYVSGSLIEGVGNSLSDLDFYVICNSIPMDISNPKECVDIIGSKDFLIDVDYLLKDDVLSIIRKIANVKRVNAVGVLNIKEKRIIHRLLNSYVLYNSEQYNSLISHINFENLRMLLIQDLELKYRDTYEDLKGNLLDRKLYSSYINCINLLDISVQLTNITLGDTNPNEKWRLEKLSQLDLKKLEIFWDIYTRKVTEIKDIIEIRGELDIQYEELYTKIKGFLPEFREDRIKI
ncbi:hypothetical protein [Bacillus pacificus]|uniref:hypothetical protein n=1 Tax=Bacillus pacificus TaxID=2026187 RepID=UPI002E1A793E|nr:hypothetical protein [Bacillus pacificus]